MRDAINDHAVAAWLRHTNAANLDELRMYVAITHGIDFFDEGARKSVLHAKDDADFVSGHLRLQRGLLFYFFEHMPASSPGCAARSEEHTSELQSRPHLVCRLLLEKKKTSN